VTYQVDDEFDEAAFDREFDDGDDEDDDDEDDGTLPPLDEEELRESLPPPGPEPEIDRYEPLDEDDDDDGFREDSDRFLV